MFYVKYSQKWLTTVSFQGAYVKSEESRKRDYGRIQYSRSFISSVKPNVGRTYVSRSRAFYRALNSRRSAVALGRI